MRIAVGRTHFDHVVSHFEYRNIKRATAEIEYYYFLVLFFVESVSECGGSRLVDNALYIKPCNLSGVFCRLTLGIVEICRYRNYRLRNSLPESRFRVSL